MQSWLEDEQRYAPAEKFGVGSPSVSIQNFAVPGATFEYPMGTVWNRAFADRPDLVIINLGLNHAMNIEPEVARGEIATGIARMMAMHPGVPIACIKQNPFRNHDGMDTVYAVFDEAAERCGVDLIDVASLFKARTGADLYLEGDNTHPNQTGQDLYANQVLSYWSSRASRVPNVPDRPNNYLDNPTFILESGVARGWQIGGTTPGVLWDVEGHTMMTASGDGYAYIYQDVPEAVLVTLRGRSISVGFDLALPLGASDGQGRMFVKVDDRMLQSRASQPPGGLSGWRAICGVHVPEDAKLIRVGVFHDQNYTPSKLPLLLRNAALSPGDWLT